MRHDNLRKRALRNQSNAQLLAPRAVILVTLYFMSSVAMISTVRTLGSAVLPLPPSLRTLIGIVQRQDGAKRERWLRRMHAFGRNGR